MAKRGEMSISSSQRMVEWRSNNPYKWLRQQLRKYGVTVEWYLKQLKWQHNVCAICGKPETNTYWDKIRRLSVDHNHQTKQARGLLCHACNTRIGMLEDFSWVAKARKYLTAAYDLSKIVLTDADYVAAGL
jgi:hypothetical protein